MKLVAIVVLASALGYATASCPSNCNGHGVCGEYDLCHCYANWQGLSCGDRVCPYGKAWVDTPAHQSAQAHSGWDHESGVAAHDYAECSNRGDCDRKTGECGCYDGYTGQGCRKSVCPNDCSGHGQCLYIDEMGENTRQDQLEDFAFLYHTEGSGAMDVRYDGWDDKASMGCVCDAGYEGLDCASMKCPRGDDPLTKQDAAGDAQVSEIQTISIRAGLGNNNLGGSYTLTYTDLYGSKWTTRPLRVRKSETYATPTTIQWTQATNTLNLVQTNGNFNGFLAGDRVSIFSSTDETNMPVDVVANTIYGWVSSIETTTNGVISIVVYSSAIADAAATALLGNAVLSHASYRVEHMKEALMTLPDNIIEDISVNYEGTFDSKTNTYSVTFVSPHNSGDQHMLQCNAAGCDVDGCQPRFEGLSDSAATNNVPTCVVTETRKGTTEAATCSNRGNCDGSTGQCECFEGFSGIDCGLQTILV